MTRLSLFFSTILLFCLVSISAQTPVAINGKLQVKGVQLCNEHGYPVQLRGMSSHGLQWYGDCVNQTTINTLKSDWGADIIRLAMYVEEGGYTQSRTPAEWKAYVKQRADWAISAGIYCIIDWHVHIPGDPMKYVTQAVDFFDYFSKLYKDSPNIIFEICNEPNKVDPNNSGWDDNMWSNHIKPFAEQVIPKIRANKPDAVVLVGNPIWSSKPGDVLLDPLTGNNAENVLYSFHFYGGSHYSQAYINQYSDKIPIFMNEWGTSINKGHFGNDYVNTQAWFDLMKGNNPGLQTMSWCNWSLCDKSETSAALAPGGCNNNVNLTSESGAFVKKEMQKPDNFIAANTTKPVFAVQPFEQKVVGGTKAYIRCKAVGPGTIQYQWYKDGVLLNDATEQILVLDNFSTANAGIYKVQASNLAGNTVSESVQIQLSTQAPKSGNPIELPGKLEVENYDAGGDGIAYNDLKHPNASEAGYFGSPAVAPIAVTTGDGAGTKALSGLGYNDWLEYTVTFTETAYYAFVAHAFSTENAPEIPQFWVALDNVKITKITDIPSSTKWTDTYSDTVLVNAGTYVMQILIEERLGRNSFNSFLFDYVNVVKLNIDCNGDMNGTAYLDGCDICVGGKTGKLPSKDTDKDGIADCKDLCPADALKSIPGICGCGTAEGECYDCAEVWGGTALVDQCGVCAGGTTGVEPDLTCVDCAGIINGKATTDNCGVCAGGSTGIIPDATCTDCAGILNGTASVDDCFVCSGGTTGKIANASCSDCLGVPNGTAVKDVCGVCNGTGSSCKGVLTPYQGAQLLIPGKIEAEYFCAGGEGIAYHDSDAANSGNTFRKTEGVDVATEGTGLCIGWIDTDEWAKYAVEVTFSGYYDIAFYTGGNGDGKTFTVEIDTLNFDISVPNTNSYTEFELVTKKHVYLKKGTFTMKITFNASAFNLDYIDFISEAIPDCAGVPNGTAYKDECNVCVGGTTGKLPTPDTDGDGVYDCSDLCPNDPLKVIPSNCGCGIADADCPDCNGDLGGTAMIDDCDVCSGGKTGILHNSSCTDCKGVVNGTAAIDICGVCAGGSTGKVPNESCKDCAGIINGLAKVDECGTCSGGNTGIAVNSSCVICDDGLAPDECGVCGGDGSSCDTIQLPYKGITRYIPGLVQAEDYDTGGEGVAFHDANSDHQGSSNYRTDAVDLDTESSGHSLSWIEDGEWTEYTLNVVRSGSYTIKVAVSSPDANRSINLYINDTLIAEDLVVPVTGGYHTFKYISVENINLEQGVLVFRMLTNGVGFNIDNVLFVAEYSIDCAGVVDGLATTDNCGNCVGGSTGLLACEEQTFSLDKGWNLISFFVEPNPDSLSIVLKPVMQSMTEIKNNNGFFTATLPQFLRRLQNSDIGEGYLINMKTANTFKIKGTPVASFTLPLKKGWNLVGMPLTTAKPITETVGSQSAKIETIKNFDGFWTPTGGVLNSINSFEPGKAYYIKATADCELLFK